jgi:hypothetical protein
MGIGAKGCPAFTDTLTQGGIRAKGGKPNESERLLAEADLGSRLNLQQY